MKALVRTLCAALLLALAATGASARSRDVALPMGVYVPLPEEYREREPSGGAALEAVYGGSTLSISVSEAEDEFSDLTDGELEQWAREKMHPEMESLGLAPERTEIFRAKNGAAYIAVYASGETAAVFRTQRRGVDLTAQLRASAAVTAEEDALLRKMLAYTAFPAAEREAPARPDRRIALAAGILTLVFLEVGAAILIIENKEKVLEKLGSGTGILEPFIAGKRFFDLALMAIFLPVIWPQLILIVILWARSWKKG